MFKPMFTKQCIYFFSRLEQSLTIYWLSWDTRRQQKL